MKKIYTIIALFTCYLFFAQQGGLDTTFGTNGVINITEFGKPNQILFQLDGKLLTYGTKLVSGNTIGTITRLNIDGTLDLTFGTNGFASFSSIAPSAKSNIALQSSGKILVTSGSNIYRLNSDGSQDLTFNNNTSLIYDANFVKVMNDQTIIGGYSNTYQLQVKKFSVDGIEDTTFNGGIYPSMNGGDGHICIGMNELDNGKLVISTKGFYGDYYISRFNANGSLDIGYPGIGNATQARDAKSINNFLYQAIQYGFNSDYSIFKYNLLGNLDTSYSGDGIAQTNFNGNSINISYNLNIQPNNKIIVVGKTGNSTSASIGLTRFNTDGTLDSTFGTEGKTITPINSLTGFKTMSALSPIDGKLTVVCRNNTADTSSENVFIGRYLTGENLSSSDFLKSSKIYLTPNPTNQYLNIITQETIKSIAIIDFLGKKTKLINFENNKVDVSNLQNGIYFIEIETENEHQIEKFIKK